MRRCARAVGANLPYSIAQREVTTVAAGNTVSVIVGYEHVTDVFTAFGAR